ncbi:MAG: conjugal transfer protein TraX [Lachnospiraceae bacterium]|nr:conjugal transfer protein TraX [Lachnospiraceae bacterium]
MDKYNSLGLTGFDLKIIAMVSMLIDHVGYVFFPDIIVFRIVGRLAFPIFCFCLAEGAYYTSNIRKYEFRLLVFALLSEIPFDYGLYHELWQPGHQNVFFTLLCGLLVIDISRSFGRKLGAVAFVILGFLSVACKFDYQIMGVSFVVIFYFMKDAEQKYRGPLFVGLLNFAANATRIQAFASVACILILFYNGEKGRGVKWLFYLFYPLHLAVIGIVYANLLS